MLACVTAMSGWPLADPVACPGLFDLLTIIVSRTWRNLPLGPLIVAGNTTLVVIALLLLARAIHTITKSAALTIAITLAAGVTAEFARVLAPSPAAAFAVTIAAWSAIVRTRQSFQSLGLLALLGATVPALILPVIAATAWLTRSRGIGRAVLAALLVLVPCLLVQLALSTAPSSLLACVVPLGGVLALKGAAELSVKLLTANPVASALAVLGLFAFKHVPREMSRTLLPLIVAAFWAAASLPSETAPVASAFLIVFWVLAGAGLREVWSYAAVNTSGKVGTLALSTALVVLQVLGANARREVTTFNDGHDRLTLTGMSAIIGALPRGAALVEEDAVTSLLTHALPSRQRSSDRFHTVAAGAGAARIALQASPVFALPQGQRVLQHLGFELAPAMAAIPGVAEVKQSVACTADLGSTPAPLAVLQGRLGFALVADDEGSRDQVVIVLNGDVPQSAGPSGWPPESLRGFQGRMFDLTNAVDQHDLTEELRSYQLTSYSLSGIRYVTRIEAWRTPGSPLVLPIALGSPVINGVVRRTTSSPNQHLRLCPSIPFAVQPLAPIGGS